MTYDHELTLIKATVIYDDIGNEIPVETETIVYCGLKSVGSKEFYNAAVSDLKPELIFVIHPYEYHGEESVVFKADEDAEEGERYRVIRTYQKDTEEMELIVEKGGVNGQNSVNGTA